MKKEFVRFLIHRLLLLIAGVGVVTAPSVVHSATVYIKDSNNGTVWWPTNVSPISVDGLAVTREFIGGRERVRDTAFDQVMRTNTSDYTEIRLGPGRFKTLGSWNDSSAQGASPGWRLGDHCRLIGYGKGGYIENGTTLEAADYNDNNDLIVVCANRTKQGQYTTASDIWVTDLQIDCGGSSLVYLDLYDGDQDGDGDPLDHPYHFQGVMLHGTGNMHVERVHVKRAMGNDWHIKEPPLKAEESWILAIAAPPCTNATGSVIADCSVTDFYAPYSRGYASAISINRWSVPCGTVEGLITGCDVDLGGHSGAWPDGTSYCAGRFAYNAHQASRLVITNCTAVGVNRGFNNDTFPNQYVSLIHNVFDIPRGQGICAIEGNTWSRIHGNEIAIRGSGSQGILVERNSDLPAERMMIDMNNVVGALQTDGNQWSGTSNPFHLHSQWLTSYIPRNVELRDNGVDEGSSGGTFVNLAPPSVGYMVGNDAWTDEISAGNSYEVVQPNSGWTYSPYRSDFTTDDTVDLLLSDSAWGNMMAFGLNGHSAVTGVAMQPSQPSDPGWRLIGVADINRDGMSDLIFYNPNPALGFYCWY